MVTLKVKPYIPGVIIFRASPTTSSTGTQEPSCKYKKEAISV
jgi:hypothetical protein